MSRAQALAAHRQKLGLEEVDDILFNQVVVEGGNETREHAFIQGMLLLEEEEQLAKRRVSFGEDRRTETDSVAV